MRKRIGTITSKAKLSMALSTGGFERFLLEGGGVDFRLNEPRWQILEEGDIFTFVEEPGHKRRYNVKILKLYRQASFDVLIDSLPNTIFQKSKKQDYLNFLSNWWTPQDEQREGTLALHIEVLGQ